MNKTEFIEWVKNLPEDFECQPIELSEVTTQNTPWDFLNSGGQVHSSVYKRKVTTNMKIDVTFSGCVTVEFKRDRMGVEHWANYKVSK